jgi:co-chaperonin GroES (HSP10)
MLMTGTGVGKLQTGDEISLRSAKTKRYWTIQPGGQLFVTNTKKGEWDNMYIYHESGSGKIGHGSKVGIYSSHFNWLVAEPGKPYAKADRNEKQVWETFRLYFTSKVVPFCLQGVKKQYVATLPSGLAAYANRGSCGPWETHYLEASKPGPIKSGDKVAIRSHHGGYWSAQRTGILQCNREQAKIWETFTIYKTDASGKKKRNGTIKYGDHILLRSYHGKWMTAEFGGNAHLIVNRNTHGGWSAFKFSKP